MEVFDCIRTRRSIRRYKDKPVEWDKVVTILEAGRLAPSAGNLQNSKFIVVRDEEIRKKVAETALNQKWMEKAPIHIIVCSEPIKSKRFYGIRGERLYTIQDCAAAIENMLLTAHSLDLRACWVGAYEEDALRRAIRRIVARVVKEAHENRGEAVENLMINQTAYELTKEVTIRTI